MPGAEHDALVARLVDAGFHTNGLRRLCRGEFSAWASTAVDVDRAHLIDEAEAMVEAVEAQEQFCEIAARRLGQEVLDFGGVA